jgi:5-methylcytosine-specific restriction endonuclease McrA
MSAIFFVSGQSAAAVHSSLKRSLKALEHARHCSVLWFADVQKRGLFRDLGYSSIYQYSEAGLGFSKSRTRDFVRLAAKLDELPKVKKAMARGELGYTKAREVVKVATPKTEDDWLKAAEAPRKELVKQVKRVKKAAKVDTNQTELLPDEPTVVAPAELPVKFQVEFTPEQEARRTALVEKLHKLGGVPNDRAELLLDALAALVEAQENGPRGPEGPPVHIHVHEDKGVITADGREVHRADAARMRCDAVICRHGERTEATIPPRIRREVLSRDRHRCQSPGCGRRHHLEVHHIVPRQKGGTNDPENLMTLCSSCHRLMHEKAVGSLDAPSMAEPGGLQPSEA